MTVSKPNVHNMIETYGRMNRMDRAMEINAGENVYPSSETVKAEAKLGKDLNRIANTLGPERADAMEADAQHLSRTAGKLEGMNEDCSTYGYGWGATHDKALGHLRAAIREQLTGPNAHLSNQMLDLYAQLTRRDRSMEINEGESVYPSYETASSVATIAKDFDRIAGAFAKACPDMPELAQRLEADAQHLARSAGKLEGMAEDGSTYGSGWGSTYDGPLTRLRQAMDHLIARPAPSSVTVPD